MYPWSALERLFTYALHSRAVWVLDLQPTPGFAALIRQVFPLCHDAFMAELARMLENSRSRSFDMIVELDTIWPLPQQIFEE